MELQTVNQTAVIEALRSSLPLFTGVSGLVLIAFGMAIQNGRFAGFLGVYGIGLALLGFGSWGLIALVKRYSVG